MKAGFVGNMRDFYGSFVFIGCTLHILNLVLMNSYFAAFGKQEKGVCSALRLSFLVHYLQLKFKSEWVDWCAKNACPGISGHMVAGGTSTRWWSIALSFSDILKFHKTIAAWCLHMINGLSSDSTFRRLFSDLGAWLLNDKVLADISFVVCFCNVWWDGEMAWFQGIGPWQANIASSDLRGGHRANEVAIHVVLARRRLLEAQAKATTYHEGFQTYREHRDACTDSAAPSLSSSSPHSELSDRKYCDKQAEYFFVTALDVQERHFRPWFQEPVDSCCAYHDLGIALPLTKALLAVYDGESTPHIESE
jgi:hypothetical protein